MGTTRCNLVLVPRVASLAIEREGVSPVAISGVKPIDALADAQVKGLLEL